MAFSRRTSTPPPGHHLRGTREVDAENRGQQLRAQPDRQRDSKQQRVDRWALAKHADHEHDQHHHEHCARQQVAKAPNPPIELGLGRPKREVMGDRTELGCRSRRDDEASGRTASHVRAHEEAVGPRGEVRRGGDDAGCLLDGKAFVGQDRLIDEEACRLEDHRVGRYEAAGAEHHDVSRHDVFQWQLDQLSIPDDSRLHSEPGTEGGRGALGAVFARASDADRRDDDRQHDGGVEPFAAGNRGCDGKQQQEEQRAAKLPPEDVESGDAVTLPEQIGSVSLQPHHGRRGGQALESGVQRLCEPQRIERPEARRDGLWRSVVFAGKHAAGRPVAWEHREPKAEAAKEQRCRQGAGEIDAGQTKHHDGRRLERAQPARHNAHRPDETGHHETGKHPAGRHVGAKRVDERPHGRGIQQHNRQVQPNRAPQDAAVSHERTVCTGHKRECRSCAR